MPRLKKLTASHGRNIERQRSAWELFRYGATYSEIARALGISRTHAHRLVAKERTRLTDEMASLADEHRAVELNRTELVIREATRIIAMRCVACNGTGRLMPDGPATLPGEDTACVSCDSSGRKYSPDLILKALDRLHRAIEQRAKLLGLFVTATTSKVDVTIHDQRDSQLTMLLAAMDDEELARELEDIARAPDYIDVEAVELPELLPGPPSYHGEMP